MPLMNDKFFIFSEFELILLDQILNYLISRY
jgi:hypothetical protein